ncbi:MAG: response regulator [Candidatus ainarchaeum sp.]|nr:response regulator [Candidatus ainarchaeum sp.]
MKRVLIIEDEPDVAETMKMLVEREGYKVDYTLDPRKGVKMVKDYDLLLLDIIMPVMSGREVLDELKKKKVKTPVIVVSAIGLPMEVSEEISRKYPGVAFVPKTEMHTSLPNTIKKLLSK